MGLIDKNPLHIRKVFKEDARKLFGALLSLVMARAGYNQPKLIKEAASHIKYYERQGWIDETDRLDMTQGMLSEVSRDKRNITLEQITILFLVLEHAYTRTDYIEMCRDAGEEPDAFPKEMQEDMHRIAGFGSLEEMVDAYDRLSPWLDQIPKKYRNGLDVPKKQKQTDPHIPAVRKTDEPQYKRLKDYINQ